MRHDQGHGQLRETLVAQVQQELLGQDVDVARTLGFGSGSAAASMAEIARRAGVVRATIYVHLTTRGSLIAAITDRAITDSYR